MSLLPTIVRPGSVEREDGVLPRNVCTRFCRALSRHFTDDSIVVAVHHNAEEGMVTVWHTQAFNGVQTSFPVPLDEDTPRANVERAAFQIAQRVTLAQGSSLAQCRNATSFCRVAQ